MNTFQWILTGVYVFLVPVALGMLARFSTLPYISDNIDFPDEKDVVSALCTASECAGRNDWRLHYECTENSITYIRNYVRLKDLKDKYRSKELSSYFFIFATVLSLLFCCLSWLIRLNCSTLLKIVFGVVALAIFIFILFIWDWKRFPNYDSTDYSKNDRFELKPITYKTTKAEAEIYFTRLYYNYNPVVQSQGAILSENMGRASIIRGIIVIVLIISAYLHLPH